MEFSEIANRSPFSFLLPAPLFPAPPTACRAARRSGPPPSHLLVAVASTRHARTRRRLSFRALEASTLAGCLRSRHAARAEPPRRPPTGARRRPRIHLLLSRAHPRALILAYPSTLGLTKNSTEPCFGIPPPLPSISAAAPHRPQWSHHLGPPLPQLDP